MTHRLIKWSLLETSEAHHPEDNLGSISLLIVQFYFIMSHLNLPCNVSPCGQFVWASGFVQMPWGWGRWHSGRCMPRWPTHDRRSVGPAQTAAHPLKSGQDTWGSHSSERVDAEETRGMGNIPDSKVNGAKMGPIWGRWAPCWPHELCYLGYLVYVYNWKWYIY